jgi:hypothetical protein
MKLKLILLLTILIIINSMGISLAANDGVITELTPVDSPYTNTGPIQIKCVTINEGPRGNIPASSCTLTITYGPTGESVDSITYNVPSLDKGESYTYIWTTSNANFPYNSFNTGGSYIVDAQWTYSGGSNSKTTSFYSVPSPWLIILIAGILIFGAAIIFKKRK